MTIEIIATLLLIAVIGIYMSRDKIIFREKIDGVTKAYNKISDVYEIGNTRTKFVTHYASGWSKISYFLESGEKVIVWLDPTGMKSRKYTFGWVDEIYNFIVVMLWSKLKLFNVSSR